MPAAESLAILAAFSIQRPARLVSPISHAAPQCFLTAHDVPGADFCAAALLVGAGLRNPATLRHGNGRRDVPHRHVSAIAGARAVECGVRPTEPPPDRWAIR